MVSGKIYLEEGEKLRWVTNDNFDDYLKIVPVSVLHPMLARYLKPDRNRSLETPNFRSKSAIPPRYTDSEQSKDAKMFGMAKTEVAKVRMRIG